MSERYRTMVVRRHVWHRYYILAGSALAVLMALGLGLLLGRGWAVADLGFDRNGVNQLKQTNRELLASSQQLEQQLAVRDAQREVDLAALELVRQQLVERGEDIGELQQALDFYRSFIAPEQLAEGLSIRNLEITSSGVEGHYRFRLVVLQKSKQNPVLEGSLSLRLEGEQEGQTRVYGFAALSDEIPAEGFKLRFRYFQLVEGSIDLPANFYPKSVKLLATARRPRKAEVEAVYTWQIQEDFAHVGK